MIGECESLAARKNNLNLCNVVMALFAGVFMIVACASWSSNVETVQRLPFMVVTGSYDLTMSGVKSEVSQCTYVGLQGACITNCGKATTAIPEDSPARDCRDKDATVKGTLYQANLVVYSEFVEKNKCKNLPSDASADVKKSCALYDTCQYGGNVTMAFAVIGCIGAILSMVIFAWRMHGDGTMAKVASIVFSTATFICCVVAFGGFQNCARDFYNNSKNVIEIMVNSKIASNEKYGVAPGVGGVMAVTSFVLFIYVMLMSIFIPSTGPTEPEHAAVETGVVDTKV
jgi:hypothetical protein